MSLAIEYDMAEVFKLVESLAWPGVVLIIFLGSRRYIDGLVARISKVKVYDVEVELKEKIVSLAIDADLFMKKEPTRTNEGRPISGVINPGEIESVERQPVAAIMNKWEELEGILYKRVMSKKGREWRGSLHAVDYLVADKLMTAEEIKLFNRLYEIRNIVAHEVSDVRISAGYAFEFLRTANLLITKLEVAAG